MDTDLKLLEFEESRFFQYFHMLITELTGLKEQEISFYFFQTPLKQNIKNLSDFEKKRLATWKFDFTHIKEKDYEIIKQIYPPDQTVAYLKQVYDGSRVYEKNGVKYLADFRSEYVNVINGSRITYDQPENWDNSIYIYGQCTARGTGVEDRHTIPSFLQNVLNRKDPNRYRVVNKAIGCGSDLYDDIMHMKETKLQPGDIVIFCTNLEIVPLYLFEQNHIAYYDTSPLFSRPHLYGEWFTDSTFHTTAKGNEVIAQYIYRILDQEVCTCSKDTTFAVPAREARLKENADHTLIFKELETYLAELITYKKSGVNGSIVMNCNPFTKGHQYLIEYAAQKVDNLYIFVVEEDASFFPYKERLNLVKQGTAHLQNIIILPSGKFMISAYTFPGYFLKDGNTEISVDVSTDVQIFGKYIAQTLDIKKRFVGEEPNDFVTRTYNAEMKSVLPHYGVELEIIERRKVQNEIISASRVRKLLEQKDFDLIKELVPTTTYQYLEEKYGL